jgi:hypothetical protein
LNVGIDHTIQLKISLGELKNERECGKRGEGMRNEKKCTQPHIGDK